MREKVLFAFVFHILFFSYKGMDCQKGKKCYFCIVQIKRLENMDYMGKLESIVILSLFAIVPLWAEGTNKVLASTAESANMKKDHTEDVDSVSWKYPGNVGLNANQAYFNDYCTDGVGSAASVDAYIRLNANYKKNKVMWDNGISAQYGFIYSDQFSGGDDVRKNMDNFALQSKFGYKAAANLYYSALGNLESQFSKGYSYEKKDVHNLDSAILVSNFFAPAYLKLALGVDYVPNQYLSFFVSPVTARFTFCTDTLLSDNYGMERNSKGEYKKVRSEVGAFAKLVSDFDLLSNVHIFSSLEGFYAYNAAVQQYNENLIDDGVYFDGIDAYLQEHPQMGLYGDDVHGWYVKWKLELTLKVTKYVNVSLRTQLKYDNAETKANKNVEKDNRQQTTDAWKLGYPVAKTQFWEAVSLGVAYKF